MCVARFEGLGRARGGALVLAVLIAACAAKEPTAVATDAASDSASSSDGGTLADGAKAACKHPTPPLEACQERWCDQPYGVGMPCTAKGGECKANDGKAGTDDLAAVMCTAAFTAGKEAFCTMPCVADAQCGAGARCAGDPANPSAGKGCVLIACVGEAKPADAGATSDGNADAASAADAPSLTDAK